jgi:hypothetical protein
VNRTLADFGSGEATVGACVLLDVHGTTPCKEYQSFVSGNVFLNRTTASANGVCLVVALAKAGGSLRCVDVSDSMEVDRSKAYSF